MKSTTLIFFFVLSSSFRALGKAAAAAAWCAAWLVGGTSKHVQLGPYPKAPGGQALPSFVEGIFLPCAQVFSIYPA